MSATTEIQWTDATWNPTTGCTKLSPGCANCYIVRTPAFRIAGRKFVKGATDLRLHADRLDTPRHWRKPRRVFVNSLSDLFHDDVPWSFIEQVFDTMQATPQHTYQVLTKRAENMRLFAEYWAFHHDGPLPNVWLGVSVENQHFADERIPRLLQTPAAVRFISAEPLLGPLNLRVDLRQFLPDGFIAAMADKPYDPSTLSKRLDWVIVGGESGRGARPFDVSWARSIVHQCKAASVPVFVKQLGADVRDAAAERDDMGARDVWPAGWMPMIDGRRAWRPDLADRKGGDPQEWPSDLRIREFPR
jgi:protein gp37